MTKSKNIPKRRFPGFEGEWEEKKLGEVSEIYDGTHQTPRYTTDGIMFLSVENIKTLKSNKYISEADFIKDFKISPQNGDVLMTRIGDIGTSNVVNSDGKLAFYVSLALIRSTQLDSNFLNTSISSINFQKELWSRTLHIAFPKKINKNEIGEVSILFPSITEQQAIGRFFQKLDKSISLQQEKLDKLKNLKKSYLAELFPAEGERVPKRRFPGFEGEWEEKKLGEVSEIYDGTHQTPRYTTDGIMFLSVENIKTLKSNKYISEADFIKDFKISPQNGDVLMTRIGDIGTSNVVNSDGKLAFYVSLALIRSTQLDSNFLNTSISSINFQKELWSRTLHIAFPKKINKNEIGEVSILFPSITEQQAIGRFFQKLDKSISLQQEKLDKLKDLKKAYLNELFV